MSIPPLIGHMITLSAEDAVIAANVATLQILRKLARRRDSDHGGISNRSLRLRFADGIHGIMAEIALSRALNVAWTPGGVHVSSGDVGGKIEVRATEYDDGHLIIYPADSDQSPYVLMVGHFPTFRIAGGILGLHAKQTDWWRDDKDPPSWWVPQRPLIEIGAIQSMAAYA